MRCFIAIEIPRNIREEIKKIQKQIPEFRGKLTEPENLHLTLKFLGEIDEEKVEEVKRRLREIKSKKFEGELDSIGFFSGNAIRIIWIHINNSEQLQEEIDKKLSDIFKKEKRYMGHLTIARVKNVKDRKEFIFGLKKIKVPKMKFEIGGFDFKQSILTEEKPIYKTIEKFDLEI